MEFKISLENLKKNNEVIVEIIALLKDNSIKENTEILKEVKNRIKKNSFLR